jgi:NAD(P)-dependent dehydrogenase (short-subunit alcohol dehydrogenase family)
VGGIGQATVTGRSVLVTGAAKGIGAATVRRLVGDGYQVFAGVRQEADAKALRDEFGDRVVPLLFDVTDDAAVAAAGVAVAEAVGDAGLAGLVNNAGIAVAAPLEFLPPDELRHQLDVNLVGQVAVTQAVLPLLRTARGRIVNVGSISDRVVAPMVGAYSASKFALAAVSDGLRLELAPWGIQVTLVEPGPIATPIWNTALAAAESLLTKMPPQVVDLYGKQIEAARANAVRNDAKGIPADEVAKVIAEALTAKRPPYRVLVGREAKIGSVVARLPGRLRHQLLLRR